MQKRLLVLVCMLVVSAILVTCFGAYLKYEILLPEGLFREKRLVEVPFAALADPAARFVLNRPKNQPRQMEPDTPPETVKAAATAPEAETQPAEQFSEHWFDDVLFIGDSRTVGLRDYARLGSADYFCSVGMTVFDVTTQRLSDQNFTDSDLQSLLRAKRYNKIYISLGLNEAGDPYQLLMEAYDALIRLVRNEQPHAVIILQSLITVSREKAASKQCFCLENIGNINAGIRDFANGSTVLYVDANEHFADEEGYMPEGMTFDGCHFYISGYEEWAKWIYDNAEMLEISFG